MCETYSDDGLESKHAVTSHDGHVRLDCSIVTPDIRALIEINRSSRVNIYWDLESCSSVFAELFHDKLRNETRASLGKFVNALEHSEAFGFTELTACGGLATSTSTSAVAYELM